MCSDAIHVHVRTYSYHAHLIVPGVIEGKNMQLSVYLLCFINV